MKLTTIFVEACSNYKKVQQTKVKAIFIFIFLVWHLVQEFFAILQLEYVYQIQERMFYGIDKNQFDITI